MGLGFLQCIVMQRVHGGRRKIHDFLRDGEPGSRVTLGCWTFLLRACIWQRTLLRRTCVSPLFLEEFHNFYVDSAGDIFSTCTSYDGLKGFFAVFYGIFRTPSIQTLSPRREPPMASKCWLSRARGGGDAGSLTPRFSATLIRCMIAAVWKNTSS